MEYGLCYQDEVIAPIRPLASFRERHGQRSAHRTCRRDIRYASEYRERGNTLFRNQYYDTADGEYELAMRYLLFNAHPNDEELPIITEGLVAVQLNLAASKLRIGREKDCISQAQKVGDCSLHLEGGLYEHK